MSQTDVQEEIQKPGGDVMGETKQTKTEVEANKVQLATRDDLWDEDEEEIHNEIALIRIDVNIGEEVVQAVIDTGATYCCINQEMYDNLAETGRVKGELPLIKVKLATAIGKKKFKIDRQVWLEIKFGNKSSHVVMFVVPGLFAPMIMGLNWLRRAKIVIDCGHGIVRYEIDVNETPEGDVVEAKKGGFISSITTRRPLRLEVKDVVKRQEADKLWKLVKERCIGRGSVEYNMRRYRYVKGKNNELADFWTRGSQDRHELNESTKYLGCLGEHDGQNDTVLGADDGCNGHPKHLEDERKCLDVISCNGGLIAETANASGKEPLEILNGRPHRENHVINKWSLLKEKWRGKLA